MTHISVLVVEDHRVVARALAALFEDEPDLRVVAIAFTAAEAQELVRSTRPDVVVLDYLLPDATGAEAATAIRRIAPAVPILFLSRDDSDLALMSAIEAGACGYLHKSRAAEEVVSAVRRCARGEMLIPATMISRLLARRRDAAQLIERLTPREREVLSLMAEGLDNIAIAGKLGIRYGSVRSHVRNLSGKLGTHSKLETVARGRELGLIEA